MSSALEEFRAQREAADAMHARVLEITVAMRDLRAEAEALMRDKDVREFLQAERDWLRQADATINQVRRFREQELHRFWPGMWRRWIVAVAFALAAAFAFGSGYAWASRPYDVELTSLRTRSEFADYVANRVLHMTPTQWRKFEALMNESKSGAR